MNITNILDYINSLYPNAHCELNYTKDYELLIAIVLSAQTTDKRVNQVTKELFTKYSTLESLATAKVEDIENIIVSIGTYKRKSIYIKSIANALLKDYQGLVPNNRQYLEKLPGVGRKTVNVFLSEFYNIPTIAVDTHIARISRRLNLAPPNATVKEIEQSLAQKIPQNQWIKAHHQLIFFGRYHCKAIKPNCPECQLKNICTYYQHKNVTSQKN